MNETICNIMLYGGIALAVIFAVAAVILFIRLDIPKVIGDLTGHTAKKQIKEIQEKGYESIQGSGASKKDAIKTKTGSGKISVRDIKSNEEISQKANERYKKAVSELEIENETVDYERETDILETEEDYEQITNILSDEEDYEQETDVLNSEEDYENETDVLSSEEDYENETDVLSSEEDYENETDVLSSEENYEQETDVLSINKAEKFITLVDVVVVHTEESI